MVVKSKGDVLRGIIGLIIIATALTGCGGSSGDSASSSTGSTASSTSSAADSIALSSSTYQVKAASSAIVTVNRTGSGSGRTSVKFTTVNGNAVAGTDYTATSGSLVWNDGDSSSRSVVVPVGASAAGKTFAISLSSIEGSADYGNPTSASIKVASATAASSTSSGATSSSVAAAAGTTTTATVAWSAPSENTNGTALTNLVGYNIYYGTSSNAMTYKIAINTVGITNYVIQNIHTGNWYFAMTAVNSDGSESSFTSPVAATL